MNLRSNRTVGVHALTALALIGLAGCGPMEEPMAENISGAPFGTTPEGEAVEIFTMTNIHGIEIRAISYGGMIISLKTPDRNGDLGDIVLGYDELQAYIDGSPYFGAIIGRYGNRIGEARFDLEGSTYTLAANDGPNHLHVGVRGFDKVDWQGEPFDTEGGVGVVFSYTSPDGEEGYPGTLQARVTYTLTNSDELVVDYLATSDKPTPVNLTQHSYFNLADAGAGDILGHELTLAADGYTPVDATLILIGGGYDHNWVLNGTSADGLTMAARVLEPTTGRTLEIRTTEPGIQFYSGNFLDGTLSGKDGVVYRHRAGFCLETQHYPDSPNQPAFPSTILRPGEEYRTRTVFHFGVAN